MGKDTKQTYNESDKPRTGSVRPVERDYRFSIDVTSADF